MSIIVFYGPIHLAVLAVLIHINMRTRVFNFHKLNSDTLTADLYFKYFNLENDLTLTIYNYLLYLLT